MKMANDLLDWINRILRKWLWLLALVPTFTDFIAAFIPSESIPSSIAAWLARIGTWQATAAFASVGFIGAAFLVHRDMRQETARLRVTLDEIANAVPRFRISLKFGDAPATDAPVIRLAALAESEGVDALVQKERDELAAAYDAATKSASRKVRDLDAASLIASLSGRTVNPHYEEQVEKYLAQYREFLLCRRLRGLVRTRLQWLEIGVTNIGFASASNVNTIIHFPKEWILDEKTEMQTLMVEDDEDYCLEPVRPEPIVGFTFGFDTGISSSHLWERFDDIQANQRKPQIEIDRLEATASATLVELAPQQCTVLDEPVALWLGDVRESMTVVIEYKVYATQLRKPQVGKIEVKIII